MRTLQQTIQMNRIENPYTQQQQSRLVGGTVCKYWLENRCKKGESCEYLHENIPDKLPECPLGTSCMRGRECPFKHIPKQIKECQFYSSGYCREGKNCKLAHVRKELCMNYLLGFCPEGPSCSLVHVKSLIHPLHDKMEFLTKK